MLVTVITTKVQSLTLMRADEKLKMIMDDEMTQIYNNIDKHGSDTEYSDLYHQRTRFFARLAPEHWKIPNWHTRKKCSDFYHQRT